MKVFQRTVASIVLLAVVNPTNAQVPTAAPPPPPTAIYPGGAPVVGVPSPGDPTSALPPDYAGAPMSGAAYPSNSYGDAISGSACYDENCPPVFAHVHSCPGTFFFRAEALMLRRSQPRPTIPLFANTSGTTLFTTDDLHFRNETGQRFEAGYEFNECATISGTFWEIQDWRPTSGISSANNDLTLAGQGGVGTANWINASNMTANYYTQIMNYEINYMNATIFDRIKLLGGFRYVDIIDRLVLGSTTTVGTPGTSFYTMRNTDRLLGGQIGALIKYDYDLWSIECTGKSGLYDNQIQFVEDFRDNNNQPTLQSQPFPPVSHVLSAVNEINLGFARRLSNHVTFRAGYNVIWITNISLASDQFDPSLRGSPENQVNQVTVREGADLFLYGVNCGLDLRF